MAANPITYAQLFDFSKPQDVLQAVRNVRELGNVYDKLISTVQADKEKYVKAVNEIVSVTGKVAKSRKDLDITTEKGRASTLEEIKNTERQFESFQKLSGAIKVSDETLRKLNKEKDAFNQKSKETLKLEREEARLKDRLASLNSKEAGEVAKLRAQITAKNAELKKSAQESLKLVTIYQRETAALNNLRNRYKDVALQYGINSRQARVLRTELTALDQRIKNVDASAGQFQRNVGNYRSALAGFAGGFRQVAAALGFTGLIFALVGAIRGAFRIFREFQRENAVLAGVLGKTRGEIGALTKDATRLGAVTARTATEVTKLQIEYARLGFTEGEILNLTEATIDGSVALNAELSRTAALVGAIVRTFDDLESTDADEIVDKLTLAANRSALSFSKLETALPIVSGAANAVGLEFSETLAVLGKLADAGIDASTSATAFRNILIESAARGKNYKELLDQVRNSTNQLTTAYDLFGKRGAVQAVILANNTAALEDLNKELGEDFAGKAAQAAAVQLDNVSGSATLAKSAIEGFVLSIEDGNGALSRFVKTLIDAFTTTVGFVTAFNEGVITGGELMAALINPLKAAEIQLKIMGKQAAAQADEQKKLQSILTQGQMFYNEALADGITNFGDFERKYGPALERNINKTQILADVQKRYTENLIADAEKIIDNNETSIEQMEEELKLLKERFKTVRDIDERERLRVEVQLLEEKIKGLKNVNRETLEFARISGLLTRQLIGNSESSRRAEAQLKELGQLYSKEGVLGKNVKEFLDNFVAQGVEAPVKVQTAFERFTARLRTTFLAFGEFINAGFEVAGIFVNQFFTNLSIKRENAFQQFEEQQQSEIDALEARRERELENERLTTEQKKAINQRYEKDISAIEDKIEKKRRESQVKAAKNAKAQAALNVALNTAQGITAALASVPPNVPLSIAIGVIGATQLAAVLSQPLPAYAQGTPREGHPGGPAIVGERGREMVVTPDGQISFTPNRSTLIDLPEGSHVLNHVLTQRAVRQMDKDYEGNKAVNEVMSKAEGNQFNQKSFQQFFKMESDHIVKGVAGALSKMPVNNWGFTDKGQVVRSVRKGNTIHKNIRLENKFK